MDNRIQTSEKHVQFADDLVTYIGKRENDCGGMRCKRLFRKAFPFGGNRKKEEPRTANEVPQIKEMPSPKPILKRRSAFGQHLRASVGEGANVETDNSQEIQEMSSIYISVDMLEKGFSTADDGEGTISPSDIAITDNTSISSDMDKCSCDSDQELANVDTREDKGKENDGFQGVQSLLVKAGLVKCSPSSYQRRVSLPDFSQGKSSNLHLIPNLAEKRLSLADFQGYYTDDNGPRRSFGCSFLPGKPLAYSVKCGPAEENGTISLNSETCKHRISHRRHSLEPKEKYNFCHSFALASIKNLYSRILEARKVSRDK